MTHAAMTIVPPADLPAHLHPDQRPYLYIANAEDELAVERLRKMVGEVRDGKIDPTPGRTGWTARMLAPEEVAVLVGRPLTHYRAVSIGSNPEIPGQDIYRL